MAYTTAFENVCPIINQRLQDAFSSDELQMEQAGYLDAVVSQVNIKNFQKVQLQGQNGEVRKVRLTYQQSLLPTQILSAKPDVCAPGFTPIVKAMEVEINEEIYSEVMTICDDDLRQICDPDGNQFKLKMIWLTMQALAKGLSNRLLALQAIMNGGFYGPVAGPMAIDLLKADDSSNVPGMTRALTAYSNSNGTPPPLVIGTGNLAMFVGNNSIGCCNSEQGIDTSLANGLYYYFADRDADAILGANHFEMISPGSVQLVSYNEYVGQFAKESAELSMGVLTDPARGIDWDFKMIYDKCDECHKLTIGMHFAYINIPLQLFPIGHPMAGVNGTFEFIGNKLP